jgi:hypothetical protein
MIELQSITGARGGELFPLRGIDIDMSKPAAWTYRPVSGQPKRQHLLCDIPGNWRVAFQCLGPRRQIGS